MASISVPAFASIHSCLLQTYSRLSDLEVRGVSDGSRGGKIWEVSPLSEASSPERFLRTARDERVAAAFGFSKQGDSRYHMPDSREFMGSVEAFNRRLGPDEKNFAIPLVFDSVYDAISPREYLDKFTHQGKLTVGIKPRRFVSRLTALAGTVFLTPEMIRLSRSQLQALFEFEAWLKSASPRLYSMVGFEEILANEAHRVSASLEQLSSAIVTETPSVQVRKSSRRSSRVPSVRISNASTSPENSVDKGIKELIANRRPPWLYLKELLQRGGKLTSRDDELSRAFERFLKEARRQDAKWYMDNYSFEQLVPGAIYSRIQLFGQVIKREPGR